MQKKKNILSLLILLVLAAATAYFLFRDNELGALFNVAKRAKPSYLLLGLLIMLLFVCNESFATRILLSSLGNKVSQLRCIKYSFVGFYYCSITPSSSGGQPAQVYFMNKDGVAAGDATLSIMTITVSYQMGMFLICLFCLIVRFRFLMANLGIVKYFGIYGAVVNILLLAVCIGSVFNTSLIEKIAAFIIRILAKLKIIKDPNKALEVLDTQIIKFSEGAKIFIKKPGILLSALGFIIIQILCRLCIAIIVYKALGLSGYSFLDILSLEAFLALGIESIPVPGSVGAAEAGFIVVNRIIFGAANLVPAALLTRGISFYSFLIISGAVALLAHISLNRRARPARRAGKS